jgi:asparagine synthase (glutamine-hydrolysing)
VPIGSCLSGGIDSTSIVCLIHSLILPRHKERVGEYQKTFSAVSEIPTLDERAFIRLVTAATGAREHLVFPVAGRFLEELDALLWHQEEPFSSSSVYAQWCVFRSRRPIGRKVSAWTGRGPTNSSAGTGSFPIFICGISLPVDHVAHFLRKAFFLLANLGFFTGIDLRHSLRYFGLGRRLGGISTIVRQEALSSGRESVRHRLERFSWPKDFARHDPIQPSLSPSIRRQELHGFFHRKPDSFLGLSPSRIPGPLPLTLKIRNGWTKFILREAMKGIIPETIRRRRGKLAFDTPQDIWLRNELRPNLT